MSEFPSSLFRLLAAARECKHSARYNWDNRLRPEASCVLQLTLEGCCRFELAGEAYRVDPGQAFLFVTPEDSSYRYIPQGDEVYALAFVAFTGASARSTWLDLRRRTGPVVNLSRGGDTETRLLDLADRFSRNRFADPFEASTAVYAMITSLARETQNPIEGSDPIERARRILINRHRTDLNIKMLAHEMGLSREHLTRIFRERFQTTPAAFLRQLRLETARELLRRSSLPLDEVARLAGLRDANILCRLVRKENGCTPSDLRRSPRA